MGETLPDDRDDGENAFGGKGRLLDGTLRFASTRLFTAAKIKRRLPHRALAGVFMFI